MKLLDPQSESHSVDRLLPVEGLRAYLALWVVVGHVLWFSGYEIGSLTRPFNLILHGSLAVDVFIMISGFVITLLIDTKREAYGPYLVRRFCRLFPVFIVLFALSIPLTVLNQWNLSQSSAILSPEQITDRLAKITNWWAQIHLSIPAHLVMLHGAVPDVVAKNVPGSFLTPAWSISLEWQFYLIAPVLYLWAVSAKRLSFFVVCLVIVVGAKTLVPYVEFGSFLPFHLKYFAIGAASYLLYARRAAPPLLDVAFPVAVCFAVLLFGASGQSEQIVPVVIWIAFMGLILEAPTSQSARFVVPLLANPVTRYLGRISYSVYLSHVLVLTLVQAAILAWAPGLHRVAHVALLLCVALPATVALSALLYRFVEAPGITVGRAWARRLREIRNPSAPAAHHESTPTR